MNETIGFGGGCHWCTEAVFNQLIGISKVHQGFIKSEPPNDYFSEAVVIEFNPQEIPLKELIEIHLRTHASTSNHSMREKYRSAIYTYTHEQAAEVASILKQLQTEFEKKLITQVLPFVEFQSSEEKYQNYFDKNAEGQFCKTYIDPKLNLLRQKYSTLIKQ